jgi:hypothetical protein
MFHHVVHCLSDRWKAQSGTGGIILADWLRAATGSRKATTLPHVEMLPVFEYTLESFPPMLTKVDGRWLANSFGHEAATVFR